MPENEAPNKLPIAVRVYPDSRGDDTSRQSKKAWTCPQVMFVFDTESRTDANQRLTFGSYRYIVSGRCVEEGLFYADDLSGAELETLKLYTETYAPETSSGGCP